MAIVSAFLVPGSPLPYLVPDNPPWTSLVRGMAAAGDALKASRPDVMLIYSTQWVAVLDQLWQTRPRLKGVHVDENWHEFGDLPFDIRTDTQLARACVKGTRRIGVTSKGVNYDHFPVDSGTIAAINLLCPGGRVPTAITTNNLYHDGKLTRKIGRMAASVARSQRKRVAVVAVGGLSGSFFRDEIDISKDRIANAGENRWNRKILRLMEAGDVSALTALVPEYAQKAKVDMGFKHFDFLLGAVGGRFKGATVHAYGPCYGTGAAVVEFKLR